jgi:hypothetical protein
MARVLILVFEGIVHKRFTIPTHDAIPAILGLLGKSQVFVRQPFP